MCTSAPPTTHMPPQPPPTLHGSACARPTTTSWPQVNKLQAPVGTLAFQAAYADASADQACLLMDNLQFLPLHQDCWLLLQNNLQQQVAHLSRGSQLAAVGPCGPGSLAGREQGCGWGFFNPPALGTGPVPSQAALTLAPQTLLPHKVHAYRPRGFPLVGPCGQDVSSHWEALPKNAGDPWQPQLSRDTQHSLDHIAKAQGTFAKHEDGARFNTLLASLGSEAGKRKSAYPPSAEFMNVLPSPARPWPWLDTLPLLHWLGSKSSKV
jgi:hypothetical protein